MDIDGKKIAQKIKDSLKEKISTKKNSKKKNHPTLAFFLMENHVPSKIYVKMKERGCKEVGITSIKKYLKADILENTLIEMIEDANNNPEIDAILVQMPLPKHIDTKKILLTIDPAKDVDGFTPENIGKMLIDDPSGILPCTPYGICKMLEEENIETSGTNIVILGRSQIVGRPLANMLSTKKYNATVTMIHSKSKNTSLYLKNADIVIAAIGIAHFLKADMIKENCTVIDVGINHLDGKLVGDVDYENVKKKAGKITPVPGGVGPMTIAMLLSNTYKCYKLKNCKIPKIL